MKARLALTNQNDRQPPGRNEKVRSYPLPCFIQRRSNPRHLLPPDFVQKSKKKRSNKKPGTAKTVWISDFVLWPLGHSPCNVCPRVCSDSTVPLKREGSNPVSQLTGRGEGGDVLSEYRVPVPKLKIRPLVLLKFSVQVQIMLGSVTLIFSHSLRTEPKK